MIILIPYRPTIRFRKSFLINIKQIHISRFQPSSTENIFNNNISHLENKSRISNLDFDSNFNFNSCLDSDIKFKNKNKNKNKLKSSTFLVSLKNTISYNDHEILQLKQLENSIIEKLEKISIDSSFNGNSDLYIIKKSPKMKPFINEIDLHILKCSQIMIPSSRFNSQNYLTKNILKSHNKFLTNNTYYDYKYKLINNSNSISEARILYDFIDRLTRYNYQNSNELIKSFLKNRIIYSDDCHHLFQENKNLSYMLINYFLQLYNYSNMSVVRKIIALMGNWDTFSLNIFLKKSIQSNFTIYQSLNIIDNVLSIFINNNLYLNKTSIYLIYMHIQRINENLLLKINEPSNLKYKFHDIILNNEINNNHTLTSIIYKELSRNFNLIDKYNNNKTLIEYLINDSLKSMKLIPKFKSLDDINITKNNFSTKSFRKLMLSTKYKDIDTFNSFLSTHITASNWKFAWNASISNYNFLKENKITIENSISKTLKNKLLKDNSPTKYTDFGKIFNYDLNKVQHYLQSTGGYNLLIYLSSISNWQLFIRSMNELNSLNDNESNFSNLSWIIYYRSLKHLFDINLSNSHLDSITYLILVKFILHKSLLTNMGSVKRSDILFRKFQFKIDKIFNTDFPHNLHNWLTKRSSVRADLEKIQSKNLLLFESCFEINKKPENWKIYNTIDEKKATNTNGNIINNNNLISPDLSIITPFEKLLFQKLSDLKILDTSEKINLEYNEYSEFWDSKNIDHKDVQSQYHLGFINRSYKYNMIKWANSQLNHIENKNDLKFSSFTINDSISDFDKFKSDKLNKLNNVIHDDLTELLNTTTNYIVYENKSSTSPKVPKYVPIDPSSSLNNILPNDWMHMVVKKSMVSWLLRSSA
jgi:hypothetical protein